MKGARFLVFGRVQDVGFRYFVAKKCREMGLVGFVRNRGNEQLEVVACGESVSMAALEKSLRNGPPLAIVEEVLTEVLDPAPVFQGFEIRP